MFIYSFLLAGWNMEDSTSSSSPQRVLALPLVLILVAAPTGPPQGGICEARSMTEQQEADKGFRLDWAVWSAFPDYREIKYEDLIHRWDPKVEGVKDVGRDGRNRWRRWERGRKERNGGVQLSELSRETQATCFGVWLHASVYSLINVVIY